MTKPDKYHTVTPYLRVAAVEPQIAFLQASFDASTSEQIEGPDKHVVHAEVRIGDSVVMMGRAGEDQGSMPCMLYVYVEDVDQSYARALAAGATSVQEPRDAFYGDRNAGVEDLHGNHWWLASQVEEVAPDELQRRAREQGS